jgi:two-component system sensor histidine kinase PilS (NtrC family)
MVLRHLDADRDHLSKLFLWACVVYFACRHCHRAGGRRLLPNLRATTFVHAMVDAIAISLLLSVERRRRQRHRHPVRRAGRRHGAARDSRDAFVLAALATLALFAQQIASHHPHRTLESFDYPSAGILGGIVFPDRLLAWPIARRLRDTEATVRRQQVDLANLAQLSQYIVQNLRESIVVVDHENRIRLINESAAVCSAIATPFRELCSARLHRNCSIYSNLAAAHRDASDAVADLRRGRRWPRHPAALRAARQNASPRRSSCFLEDTELLAPKIQQSKLCRPRPPVRQHRARNPQSGGSDESRRATARRVAVVVGRRQTSHRDRAHQRRSRAADHRECDVDGSAGNSRPERLILSAWLAGFRDEFCATMQIAPDRLAISSLLGDVEIQVDPSQLRQIVWNLCENAAKYGKSESGEDHIELRVGRLASTARPFLEVADRGAGKPAQHREKIFEPFFTGNERGTGLGLFLARELAQTNGATLLYEPRTSGGSLFRIVFRDPERWVA